MTDELDELERDLVLDLDALRAPMAIDDVDLTGAVSAHVGARRSFARSLPPALFAAAAVCAFVVFGVAHRASDDGGFRAKGALAGIADGAHDGDLVGVDVYRVEGGDGGRLVSANGRAHARDALGFKVTNLARFTHLLIFGVDARAAIVWYEPAPAENARSIAIGDGAAMLNDVVAHDLAPGPLRIVAVFSDGPLDANRVAHTVAAAGLSLPVDANDARAGRIAVSVVDVAVDP